jgi:hypothetical protein
MVCAVLVIAIQFVARTGAANSANSLLPAGPEATPFSGTYDPHAYPCATVANQFTVGTGKLRIVIQANATVPTNDISVNLLYGTGLAAVFVDGEDTGTCCEAMVYEPAGGVPPGIYQVKICQTPNTSGVPQNSPFTYNGVFTTDDTQTTPGNPVPPAPVAPPAAPQDNGPKSGFENFAGPGVLTQVTSSSQGPSAATVEYLGHDAGEPSMGVNWLSPGSATGVTAYQSDLQTLFVTFDDTCPASGQKATWVNRPAPTSQFVDSDPIGFTDRQTGRTFAGELTLLSPTCKTSFTDNDGQTWVASQGSGLAAGTDHQTIGGGPFAAPLTRPTGVPGLYPNAVYYCSQLPHSSCARSDNGGATFGPAIEIDPVADQHCGGLHGHLKVAPDGTVYVPMNDCDNFGAVVASEDNGITWSIRHVPNTISNPNLQDPAVSVDNAGRLYFAMSSARPGNTPGTTGVVAVSVDRGQNWTNIYDVGANSGLNNVAFPTSVAADLNRASVAFYGSTTTGDASANAFNGVWHLYVASTFDGGGTWSVTDATPNAPMQRGCIWMHGGADICRNLLDFFDMTVDKTGRVQVGYVNGCAGGNCAQAAATASGNAYTALATIARQSSGRRLVAAFDPLSPTSVPGMPSVTQRRIGGVVHLSWSLADNGNSPITNYQILRGTASGGESLLTTVPGSQTTYDDTTATNTSTTYYYKVVALNAVGQSCGNNEISAPYVGDTCTGVIVQRTPPGHPEQAAQGAAPASLAIDYVAVGEPPFANGSQNLMFKMKVTSLASVPPNSRWRIVWNSYASPGQQFFVGMRTNDSGVASFEYGTIATAVVGLVIGVPTETTVGAALSQSNFTADGTITIYVPKSAVGNPQPGDLLGAVNGRTFTGDTAQTANFERSTALIDHTFVKAQRDNGEPAATYTVAGNVSGTLTNFASSTLGSIATASTSHSSGLYPAAATINGDRTGNSWGTVNGGWNDGTRGAWPDMLDVNFNATRSISEIRVYTLQNNWQTAGEPTLTTSCSGEGILDFEVQYWNGTDWVTVPGGTVTGNDKAMRVFTFPTIATSQVRVKVNNARNNWSRIVEVEAFGSSCSAVP